MNKIKLSIIIVNYNTKNLLKNSIDSILSNTKELYFEIIVVDNSSTDGSCEMIREYFPNVRLIINNENLGFSRANNQAIKVAKGEHILLLNSDTVILNNCLEKIFNFVRRKFDAGIVGCKVLNKDGTLQYTCQHFPSLLSEIIKFTLQIIKGFWDPVTLYQTMKYWKHNQIRGVDQISGCFLWINRSVIKSIGYLDENILMYYEDSEFCSRVKLLSDYKIYYFPYAKIIHLQFGGKRFDELDFFRVKNCYISCQYYIKKYYGEISYKIFIYSCRIIWSLEILLFSFFKFNDKFKRKLLMLKELYNLGRHKSSL